MNFGHSGLISAKKNKTFGNNYKSVSYNLPPTTTKNCSKKMLKNQVQESSRQIHFTFTFKVNSWDIRGKFLKKIFLPIYFYPIFACYCGPLFVGDQIPSIFKTHSKHVQNIFNKFFVKKDEHSNLRCCL